MAQAHGRTDRPLRALHIFPHLADDLTAGSDYYQHRLTRELLRLDVEVEVLTTCTRRVEPRAAFGLGWPNDYPRGVAAVDGVRVTRFPVPWSPPTALGHLLSRPIIARWRHEQANEAGGALGADGVVASFHRRALARPRAYDLLALLGRGPWSPGLIAAARRAAGRADIILAGFAPFATLWQATRIARRAGLPLVLLPLFHPEDLYHHFRALYECFQRADALLAQTPYSAALFERLLPGSRPLALGLGIDPAELDAPHISGARFRQQHGLGDAPLALFVGRKEEHKRYDLAVDAIERVPDSRARLVLIGADVDRRPITSTRARYLGPLPRAELLDAYDACDVFVLPSEHESFGVVFLEAWMRGKPVIGNARCQPVRSVIEDGVDGLLAEDGAQLADRLNSLFADPQRAARLGGAGREKVLARYTWERIGRRVHELYLRLTAGR